MGDVLDADLAVTFDNVQGFLGPVVDVACRRVRVDGQPVGHQVFRAELAVDQPLDAAPIDGTAFNIAFLTQARPMLLQHDLRMIATTKPLRSRRRQKWSTARWGGPG